MPEPFPCASKIAARDRGSDGVFRAGQFWVNLSKFYLWDYDLKIGTILFVKIAEDKKSLSFFYKRPIGESKAVKVTESGHGSGRLTIPKSLMEKLMWDEGRYGFYHHEFVEIHIRKLKE